MEPYYSDETVTLYLGDMREVLPLFTRAQQFACVIADPPYAETSLEWDRWPDGWPQLIAEHASSMWSFGSLRMFGERWAQFTAAHWKLSHDTIGEFEVDTAVWEKHNGSGFANDRFKKVHELAAHWYRGPWESVYRDPQFEAAGPKRSGEKGSNAGPPHAGAIGPGGSLRGHERLIRSVIRARSMNGCAIHPTEKPVGILDPLIRYACPPGGTVLDPFAGSGSTAVAARLSGRRSVLIEGFEPYCEAIAIRLQQDVLPLADLLEGTP